ncbi:hypothetical protein JCM19238_2538 [Vibrio ponticus]|nr:hypothetical protein JCM19238_2538 [Vibrio ponticus]
MNNKAIKLGFIAAAAMNIGGVLVFSRGLSNQVINQFDPVVMSNFGLLMIMIWGLAYLGAATITSKLTWLAAAFAWKSWFMW